MRNMKNKGWLAALFGMAVLMEGASAQTSVYVKLRPEGTKKAVALKAGTKLGLASLPVKALASGRFALEDDVVSVGMSFAPATQGLYRLDCVDEAQVDELLDSLNADPMVEYAERVPVRRVFATVNDPYYVNASVADLNLRWHLDLIHAEEAWDMAKTDSNLRVAVVDNAVWGEHEDLQIDTSLQYNVYTGEKNSAPPATVDNTTDCDMASFYQQTCLSYNWSHGTHSAGLIGAKNNNGVGIASVAGGVKLMGVNCGIEESAGLSVGNTAEGIAWAVDNGAKVINMSFGDNLYSRTEHLIIEEAAEAGVIFVAASGNSGGTDMMYPAAYPEVIGVASCDYDKNISEFSDRGGWVDILAPGGYGPNASADNIFSTTFCRSQDLVLSGYEDFQGKYYDRMIGTSMAAPVAASVIALLLSQDSTLDYRDVRSILMESAQPSLTSGIVENSGVIDAAEALRVLAEYEKPSEPSCLQSFRVKKEEGDKVPHLYWTKNNSASASGVSLRLYRNNVMLADDIALDAGRFDDSTAWGGYVYRYEICEVDAEGNESYRLAAMVDMPAQCNLYLVASPAEAGTVSGSGMYEENTYAVITAKANPGWKFDYWSFSGQVLSEYDSVSVLIGSSARITAMFSSVTANEDSGRPGKEPEIVVVPNPVEDAFVLQGVDAGRVEEVRLLNGQGVLLKSWSGGDSRYDVSGLEPGLYLADVRLEDGRHLVLKLMVR